MSAAVHTAVRAGIKLLIATTPRTTPFMKKLVAMDDVRITTGSTYDNAAHLSADAGCVETRGSGDPGPLFGGLR